MTSEFLRQKHTKNYFVSFQLRILSNVKKKKKIMKVFGLKIAQNVIEFLIFDIFHQFFVLLKLTILTTLFYRKL